MAGGTLGNPLFEGANSFFFSFCLRFCNMTENVYYVFTKKAALILQFFFSSCLFSSRCLSVFLPSSSLLSQVSSLRMHGEDGVLHSSKKKKLYQTNVLAQSFSIHTSFQHTSTLVAYFIDKSPQRISGKRYSADCRYQICLLFQSAFLTAL